MKCPHCAIEFYDKSNAIYGGKDIDGMWYLLRKSCPACHRLTFHLYNKKEENTGEKVSLSNHLSIGAQYILSIEEVPEEKTILIRPKNSYRSPCPLQVPKEIAEDYTEACLTLTDSPKASAALSRRCLQNILRDPNTANAQQKELLQQIEYVLKSKV